MAQDGDTITYTFSDGSSVAEDVSAVDEMTIDYIEGSGNETNGGFVENVVVDVSGYDTIYIWVAGGQSGRYDGAAGGASTGNGSTEVSFVNTDSSDSDDEPFIAGSGGSYGSSFTGTAGGARGGIGGSSGAEGTPPPQGGSPTQTADGAVADIPEVIDSGKTVVNGGSSGDGEVQISYTSTGGGSPPSAPTNLSATLQ